MNKIRQYRPAYFEGFENEVVEFSTVEELLSIPWVKKFSPDKYSLSGDMLMAEYRGGKEWWVVGHIFEPANVDLPEWKPVYS